LEAERDDPDFEVDFRHYYYSAVLACDNPACGERVHMAGEGGIEQVEEEVHPEHGPHGPLVEVFRPAVFVPPLPLFRVPPGTDEKVRAELGACFKVFFLDFHAAANHLRQALELLLDTFRIARYRNVKGKRHFISPHARIERLPPRHARLKTLLLAVKWIGNMGSHGGRHLNKQDVLDACEMMERCLLLLHDDHDKRLEKRAHEIHRAKGPPRMTWKRLLSRKR
ncbi:MAG: DUF4145 domain-containing protein, partial [Verrucomicrobiaceae bacterium]|nr:DUF4145 domain-containing protein [Verrucomicrobiaceae bacterium]